MPINKDLKTINEKFKKELNRNISRRQMRELAKYVLSLVKERTRQGIGVTPTGRRFRLPPFEESYIEYRIRNSRRLSPFAFISKPNNTFSGKMLSDLRTNTLKKGGFSLGFKSRESRKKAEYLAEMGRDFMNLSRKEVGFIAEYFRERIIDIDI